MKRMLLAASCMLAACDAGGGGPAGGLPEFLVIGARMTFEDCRARGGLIIRDADTNMVACDPSIRRTPVPADEFDNPTSNPVS